MVVFNCTGVAKNEVKSSLLPMISDFKSELSPSFAFFNLPVVFLIFFAAFDKSLPESDNVFFICDKSESTESDNL